ncbi:MAG TPA: protein kinase [Polyangiaceae bacterium]|nr:protein kinase [Polyangiaceae bacterium]
MFNEFVQGELVPGTSYRVVSCIGQGGMGSVYEVEHNELGKRFVLKALLREFLGRGDLVRRLRNEWRALGSLEHPHIVSVTDAGATPTGVPYYVMERLSGENLAERIKRQGRLELGEALRITVEVLDALSAAHAIGVVHRDIKPPNIFLRRHGGCKILDFGIAKLLDGDASITGRGVAIGTPRYMSPEQASGEPVDERADLYAVGLVLFEMLSGQSPFEGSSAQEVFLAHVTKLAPRLNTLVPTIPASLDELVARLLAKKPAERVRSAKRVAEIIRQIVHTSLPRLSGFEDTDVVPFSSQLTAEEAVASDRPAASSRATKESPGGVPRPPSSRGPRSGSPGATEVLTYQDPAPPTRTSAPPIAGLAEVAASPVPWGLTPMPQFRGYSPKARSLFMRWGLAAVGLLLSVVLVRVGRSSLSSPVNGGETLAMTPASSVGSAIDTPRSKASPVVAAAGAPPTVSAVTGSEAERASADHSPSNAQNTSPSTLIPNRDRPVVGVSKGSAPSEGSHHAVESGPARSVPLQGEPPAEERVTPPRETEDEVGVMPAAARAKPSPAPGVTPKADSPGSSERRLPTSGL